MGKPLVRRTGLDCPQSWNPRWPSATRQPSCIADAARLVGPAVTVDADRNYEATIGAIAWTSKAVIYGLLFGLCKALLINACGGSGNRLDMTAEVDQASEKFRRKLMLHKSHRLTYNAAIRL